MAVTVCGLAAASLGLPVGTVSAQNAASAATQGGAGMDGKIIDAGSGSATTAARSKLVDPGNGGVAGTGLGKVPAGDKTGTGMSVKGPAGQGISTDTAK